MRPLVYIFSISLSAVAPPRAPLPAVFGQNSGQTAPQVRYIGRAPGAGLWLLDSGAVLRVDQKGRQAVLSMTLEGARRHPRMEDVQPLAARANYFIGNDPDKWRTHVPLFGELLYRDIRASTCCSSPLDWVLVRGTIECAGALVHRDFHSSDHFVISTELRF
jgi:hypothetical protein